VRHTSDAPDRRTARSGKPDGAEGGGGTVIPTRTKVSLAALATFAVLAVACTNVSTSSPAAGAGAGSVPDNSGTTINFAINPWAGSEANVAVAQALLEQKLGYSVTTKKIDEYAQFPALSNGTLDATMEVWPSGHAKDYKQYIQGNNGVVDGGKLGVVGQIGWWVPTYMLPDPPALGTWEGLCKDGSY